MLLPVRERKKHHPPQVMARIHFCATRAFVEKAPKNPRERNFMARLSQECFMSLTDTVYTGTMRSGNHGSAPKGENKQQNAASAFTWLVALAIEEKLSNSFLHR